MDICISSRHSPSASDCMEGVSFFYPSLEMPLLWNRNSVPVFPCPELPFPFRSCFLGLANQLPGRHLFPCAFSSRTVFLFVLPIPKKQETYHPNRTAACCRLGYFFHFLFARIPLERSRCRPSQPYLHHGLMVFNMFLVGFILSAYRYDLVTAEPAECTSTVSL